MTSLSWLIYWIGTLDSINGVLFFGAIITTICMIPLIITYFTKEFAGCFYGNMKEEDKRNQWRAMWKTLAKLLIPLWVASIVLNIFVPTRQTVLLIAGAEIAQTVVQSEAVQSVVNPGVDLLKAWMAKETANLKLPIPVPGEKK